MTVIELSFFLLRLFWMFRRKMDWREVVIVNIGRVVRRMLKVRNGGSL